MITSERKSSAVMVGSASGLPLSEPMRFAARGKEIFSLPFLLNRVEATSGLGVSSEGFGVKHLRSGLYRSVNRCSAKATAIVALGNVGSGEVRE